MRDILASIETEYRRYKGLGDGAIEQLFDDELTRAASAGGNSVAVLVWHLSGNFASRFTDFLTSDGEKPWRHRDEEFDERQVTREELVAKWNIGWTILADALAHLGDGNLQDTVVIRGVELKVHEALHRSLAHTSYHVGQMVFLARLFRGNAWKTLTIARGASEAYNANPTRERPPASSG
ncbi:MAG TPA: DUF1572 family protein [Vicinamibacterales bacterium]